MAEVTLGQGVRVAILESFPQITEVRDTTDHAQGANPYYQAAKK
jgi:Fe-S cluster biogenesis protein NfuA